MFDVGAIFGRLILQDQFSGVLTSAGAKTKKFSAETANTFASLESRAKRLNDLLQNAKFGSERFKSLNRELQNVNRTLDKQRSIASSGGLGSMFGDLGRVLPIASIGMAGVASGLALIAKNALVAGAELEQTKTAFAVYLGGGEKGAAAAKAFVDELNHIADVTPFTNQEIIGTGKLLLSFGQTTEEVKENLQVLGDIAAGTNQPISDLGRILGQVQAKGRLQSEELMQFMERGINLIPELKRVTGKGGVALQKMISSGQIGFDTFQQALKGMTVEGGRFFEMMKVQSQTFSGLLSTIQGQSQNFLATLGEGAAKGLKPLLKSIAEDQGSMAKNAKEWAFQIEKVATSFSELIIDIKQPFTDIAEMFGDMGGDISLINAGMFSFGLAIRMALTPLKMIVDGFKILDGVLYAIEHDDTGKLEYILDQVGEEWERETANIKKSWDRIFEGKNPEVKIKLEIPEQNRKKFQADVKDDAEKASKELVKEHEKAMSLAQAAYSRALKESQEAMVASAREALAAQSQAARESMEANKAQGFQERETQEKADITVDLKNQLAQLGTSPDIRGLAEKAGKMFADKFSDGSEEGLKKSIGFARGLGEVVSQAMDAIGSMISSSFEIAANKLQKTAGQVNLIADVWLMKWQQSKQAELDLFIATEDAKIQALRDASAERLAIVDEEFDARKAALEAELQQQLANIETERIARVEDVESKAQTQAQEVVDRGIVNQDALDQEEQAKRDHQDKVRALEEETRNKKKAEEDATTKAIEIEDAKKAKSVEAFNKKKEKEEREHKKRMAAINYGFELAAFHISQQRAIAMAKFQFAQAAIGAVSTGLQFGIAAPVMIPLLMGFATAAFGMSLAAIHSTPPPLPPAELFAQSGGELVGPTHSQGGIAVRAEGGERILNRAQNARLNEMLDRGSQPTVVVQFAQGAIIVHGNMDQQALDKLSSMIAQRIQQRRY